MTLGTNRKLHSRDAATGLRECRRGVRRGIYRQGAREFVRISSWLAAESENGPMILP